VLAFLAGGLGAAIVWMLAGWQAGAAQRAWPAVWHAR
jgi:hypothetical protein